MCSNPAGELLICKMGHLKPIDDWLKEECNLRITIFLKVKNRSPKN